MILLKNTTSEHTKKMQTHKYRELVVIGREKKAGRGQIEVGDLEVTTTRYIK